MTDPTVNHPELDDAALGANVAEDPWRSWIVWRRRTPLHADWAPVLAAAGTCQMLDAAWDEEQTARLATWADGAWGKVALGAKRPAEFTATLDLPGITLGGPDGEPACHVVLPARRSEQPHVLSRLQALVHHPTDGDPPAPEGRHAVYCVEEDSPMSLGKLTAQVAHAAMLLRATHPDADWAAAGYPGALRRVTSAQWDELAAAHQSVYIRDAGLTELAPGTRTVLAYL